VLGWMIVFALLAILNGVISVAAGPASGILCCKLATALFGFLFLASVLTSVARGRT
jgi:hypothetical protein